MIHDTQDLRVGCWLRSLDDISRGSQLSGYSVLLLLPHHRITTQSPRYKTARFYITTLHAVVSSKPDIPLLTPPPFDIILNPPRHSLPSPQIIQHLAGVHHMTPFIR